MQGLCLCTLFLLGPPDERIHFRLADQRLEVSASLPEAAKVQLKSGPLASEQGESWLRLRVLDPQSDRLGPPILGAYERRDELLLFRARYQPEPGVVYRAELGPVAKTLSVAEYRLPERAAGPAPQVVKIYPTADVLPANHLKFYIYFSEPMRGGKEIFEQIVILDADGKEIVAPWLLDELWEEGDQCLILYIHPGRIKWGVLLRELLGPVLLPDREYSLVLRGSMRGAAGRPLDKDFVKRFRTTAEDRRRIELGDWKIEAPSEATQQGLTVTFPKSLDHKSLGRFLTIHDAADRPLEGSLVIRKNETSWTFTPKTPWSAQEYRLKVDGRLEDVAGNTPLRPFDLDLRAKAPPPQSLELTFRPSAK